MSAPNAPTAIIADGPDHHIETSSTRTPASGFSGDESPPRFAAAGTSTRSTSSSGPRSTGGVPSIR